MVKLPVVNRTGQVIRAGDEARTSVQLHGPAGVGDQIRGLDIKLDESRISCGVDPVCGRDGAVSEIDRSSGEL